MPNNLIITPKALVIILLASAGKEVGGFMVQLPEQLLMEIQSRAVNFGIQYGAIAIGQAVVGSKFVDPAAPARLFVQGVESLNNASLTFGGFLIVLAQNVLLPGSHVIFSKGLVKIYVIKNILIRVVTEIGVEIKRRNLGLPRAKFKFNIFRKEEKKNFVFKYLRFKKRKIKILSRDISLPVPYQKELII